MLLEDIEHALELVLVGLLLTMDLCFTGEDDVAHLGIQKHHLVLMREGLEYALGMKRCLPFNSVWKK